MTSTTQTWLHFAYSSFKEKKAQKKPFPGLNPSFRRCITHCDELKTCLAWQKSTPRVRPKLRCLTLPTLRGLSGVWWMRMTTEWRMSDGFLEWNGAPRWTAWQERGHENMETARFERQSHCRDASVSHNCKAVRRWEQITDKQTPPPHANESRFVFFLITHWIT